ncbi:MAG: ribonuclease P protein subunit [Methanobrevibacter sp.]|uniref:ribonuclease P component 1 family protein n=1 Tax=Methanobrevibacter sp. TaxID=66852 RepID=UPI0026DF2DFA|nr:ribonuclease P protein subunit [Methanobrevibacter sp.]MDO5848782.1 ribonuclease P protein subunit [Methanobrevibacter sp.]
MITSKNLVHHEFIGLNVRVISSTNKSLDLNGIIIDETKNTIKIEVKNDKGIYEEKLIPKINSIFQFKLPNNEIIEIEGNILSIRPEDRIKKRFKKI